MLALAHVILDIRYVILVVQTGNCSIESPCTAKLFPHHMYDAAKTGRCKGSGKPLIRNENNRKLLILNEYFLDLKTSDGLNCS